MSSCPVTPPGVTPACGEELNPVVPWLVLGIASAAVAVLIARPALIPQYHDLVWSRYSGIVLAVNAAIGWALIGLHELGNLATARAAGIPARLSFGTRLQFLAAQTDVSGIWAAPRRIRLTVYLAGMAVNLLAAAGCILIIGFAHPAGLAHQVLAAAAAESVLLLPVQFLVFMRTDVYFLIQDLAGCANLYADGSARIRYLARRAWHASWRSRQPPHDPTQALARRERRAVHAYSWLLVFGTTACLAAAAFTTAPAVIALLTHAIGEITGSSSPARQADGAAAVAVLGVFQVVWLRTWWRRHGPRALAYLKARNHRTAEGR